MASARVINAGLDWNTGLANLESDLWRALEDLPSSNAHSDRPLQVYSFILCPCTHFLTSALHFQTNLSHRAWVYALPGNECKD